MSTIPGCLSSPRDLEDSLDWASCGHAAVAALCGVQLAAVRSSMPKPWTTPTQALAGLRAMDRAFAGVESHYPDAQRPMWPLEVAAEVNRNLLSWPPTALVWIQFLGPWCCPDRDVRASYKYTHWVATRTVRDGTRWTYDVNVQLDYGQGWLPHAEWERIVPPALVASHRRAVGWAARQFLRVSLS